MAGKKTTIVSFRITERDIDLFRRAARKLWPRIELSRSAMVLGLAKMAAEDALKK